MSGAQAHKEIRRVKVLGLVGSPRKGGNTDVLVDHVLDGAKDRKAEVEKLYLRDLNISFCQGCFSCETAGKCVIPDDMVLVSAKLREAKGIIVGAPVYMANVSAQLVNVFDRCRQLYSYFDLLASANTSAAEIRSLAREKTCLRLWKGTKSYLQVARRTEEIMSAAIKSYTAKYGSHPGATRRLEKGKRAVIILCYYQYGEDRYKEALDWMKTNVGNFWGVELVDVIAAYRVLERDDALKRADLMERAFRAGQLLAQD